MRSDLDQTRIDKLNTLLESAITKQDYQSSHLYLTNLVCLLEKTPFDSAPELADAFYNLAVVCVYTDKLEDAQNFANQAVGYRKLVYGSGHPKHSKAQELVIKVRSLLLDQSVVCKSSVIQNVFPR